MIRSKFSIRNINQNLRDEDSKSFLNQISVKVKDGLYFWINSPFRIEAIKDICNFSLIEIKEGKVNFINWSENQQYPSKFYSKMIRRGYIYALLYKFRIERDEIYKIFEDIEDIFQLSIKEEINNYIKILDNIRLSFLRNLYLALMYFLNGEKTNATCSLQYCIHTINRYGLTNYGDYFLRIENLLKTSPISNRSYIKSVCMIRQPKESFEPTDYKSLLYVERTEYSLKNLLNHRFSSGFGNKEYWLNQIDKIKPNIIILSGHAKQNNGYYIESVSSSNNLIRENLEYENLKGWLSKLNEKYENIIVFDFACNDDYYLINNYYPIDIYMFNNSLGKPSVFNYQSGYYYLLGFMRVFETEKDIRNAHEAGRLVMSMYSPEFVDTYKFKKLNRS